MTNLLRTSPGGFYYPQDRHFNPLGHAKAAELIGEFLRREGLVPAAAK
jgi:hypothetical protein